MHYLLMIHGQEAGGPPPSQEQIAAIMEAMEAFDRELSEAGQNLGSIRLQPAATARIVRVRDGEALSTDGPFAEAKEQLGGIYIIEAAGQAEAEAIAGKLPTAGFGSVEVRPVYGIDLRQTILQVYES